MCIKCVLLTTSPISSVGNIVAFMILVLFYATSTGNIGYEPTIDRSIYRFLSLLDCAGERTKVKLVVISLGKYSSSTRSVLSCVCVCCACTLCVYVRFGHQKLDEKNQTHTTIIFLLTTCLQIFPACPGGLLTISIRIRDKMDRNRPLPSEEPRAY